MPGNNACKLNSPVNLFSCACNFINLGAFKVENGVILVKLFFSIFKFVADINGNVPPVIPFDVYTTSSRAIGVKPVWLVTSVTWKASAGNTFSVGGESKAASALLYMYLNFVKLFGNPRLTSASAIGLSIFIKSHSLISNSTNDVLDAKDGIGPATSACLRLIVFSDVQFWNLEVPLSLTIWKRPSINLSTDGLFKPPVVSFWLSYLILKAVNDVRLVLPLKFGMPSFVSWTFTVCKLLLYVPFR